VESFFSKMTRQRIRRGIFRSTAGDDHVHLAADQIGGQFGQPIIMTLRPAELDCQVAALRIAGIAQC